MIKRKSYRYIESAVLRFYSVLLVFVAISCDVTIPRKEDVPELITRVTLTFSPKSGGDPIVIAAVDPDGEGVQNIEPEGLIVLDNNSEYILTLTLTNELAKPGDEAYDVTAEVEEEGDEHLIYYSWTGSLFVDPAGDGNIDVRSDPLNYNDEDVNGLPIGLSTTWTTGNASVGSIRIVLKHQPDLKSEISQASDGETDLDIIFQVEVQ
jgi:hypothetical protein